jgi:hypothetical protein
MQVNFGQLAHDPPSAIAGTIIDQYQLIGIPDTFLAYGFNTAVHLPYAILFVVAGHHNRQTKSDHIQFSKHFHFGTRNNTDNRDQESILIAVPFVQTVLVLQVRKYHVIEEATMS